MLSIATQRVHRYSLERDASGRFAIDPLTGEIVTEVSLNREDREVYHLVVMATDGGSIPMSSTIPVTVNVGDENDNAPRFLQPVYDVRLKDPTLNGKR